MGPGQYPQYTRAHLGGEAVGSSKPQEPTNSQKIKNGRGRFGFGEREG